jgi:hypothetical protein
MTRSANDCWLQVPPAVESSSAIDDFARQRADIQTCIDALPESDRLIVFFDSPHGNPIHREVVSTPDGIPVERHGDRGGWERVRLESGVDAWVEQETVARLLLD